MIEKNNAQTHGAETFTVRSIEINQQKRPLNTIGDETFERFLQRELCIGLDLVVMGWCPRERVCMCVTKSAQSAGKPIFGVGRPIDGEVQKCQDSARDLDLDLEKNEVKVRRSRNFN